MASSCGLVSNAGWLADFLTLVTRRPTSYDTNGSDGPLPESGQPRTLGAGVAGPTRERLGTGQPAPGLGGLMLMSPGQ